MVVRESQDRPVIPQFYAGREVFITGATGFMGKVLVERLLATCPNIGYLHLLMRTKKDVSPDSRLRELKESKVFDVLRRNNPEQLDKLRIVSGDITKPHLGLSDRSKTDLEKVSVVFNTAATVKFDEDLSSAVGTNVLSVMRLLDICDHLPNIRVFVHVSTAYCNSERDLVEERVYPPPRSLHRIIEEAQRLRHITLQDTRRLISPKPNTYTFTKMLAENVMIQHGYKGYPLAIFRPTIVIASLRHPFPGWMENYNGPSGVAAGVYRGVLRVMRCEGVARADMLPVDIAIDTLIAAAWETAIDDLSTVRVYNCSTSENPTDWETVRRCIVDTARESPSAHAVWYPCFTFASSRLTYKTLEFLLQTLPLHLAEFIRTLFSNKNNSMNMCRLSTRLSSMNDALEYFATREFRFPTDNVRRLRARLSTRDANTYNLDPNTIEWQGALTEFVRGTRRHVLLEKDDTIPAAKKRLRRLYILHRGLTLLISTLITVYLLTKQRSYYVLQSIIKIVTWLYHQILYNMSDNVK